MPHIFKKFRVYNVIVKHRKHEPLDHFGRIFDNIDKRCAKSKVGFCFLSVLTKGTFGKVADHTLNNADNLFAPDVSKVFGVVEKPLFAP